MSSQRLTLVSLLVLAGIFVWMYRTSVYDDRPAFDKPNLVLITAGSGEYWQMIANGARASANDLEVNLDIQMPERVEDLKSQQDILNSLDFQSVDGLVLSPINAEVQTRAIDRYCENTLVVTIDSDAPLSSRLIYVGTSNFAAGQKSGRLVREALPDGGRIAVLLANLTKDNMLERKAGLEEELDQAKSDDAADAPAYEILGYYADEGDDQLCKQQIHELLHNDGDVDCIVALAARHGPILLEVLRQEKALDSVKVIAFDSPEETLEGISAGHVFATVAQDPYQYGYEAIQLMASLSRRKAQELPPPGLYSTMNIVTKIVRQADVEEFRNTIHRRMEEKSKTSE